IWRPRSHAGPQSIVKSGMDDLYTTFASPLGTLLAVGDGRALKRLDMQDAPRATRINPGWRRDDGAFAGLCSQLEEYFAGARREFDLALQPHGSEFELRVWR